MRIVSLVPSASEIVGALGAASDLVGRSHECDFPDSIAHARVLTAQRTGSNPDPGAIDREVRSLRDSGEALYTLDCEGLMGIVPDVILTQDLCSVCSIDLGTVREIAADMDPSPEIVSLSPEGIEDILDDIVRVGSAIGMEAAARHLLVELRQRMDRAAEFVNPYDDGPSVALLEWTDPLFVGGHWCVQIVERAGARHPLNGTTIVHGSGAAVGPQMAQRLAGPSIAVSAEDLVRSAPEHLVIAPCGFTLDQTRACAAELMTKDWFRELPAVRSGRVALVDGTQMFARPGPRVIDALEFMTGWINDRPELIPGGFPWEPMAV